MGDFFCQHIAYDRGAVLFFEFPRKIILADVEFFGEKIEGDRLRVVLVQIVQNAEISAPVRSVSVQINVRILTICWAVRRSVSSVGSS